MSTERSLILPFARGLTACDGISTPDTTIFADIVGKIYEVEDTEHGYGPKVKLIALRNETGASITTTAYSHFFEFDTAAGQFGKEVLVACDTQGAVCVAIDDAYPTGTVILEHDIFWGIYEGPVDVTAETTTPAQGTACTSNASGEVNDAAAAAGEFSPGVLDAAPAAGHVVVHIQGGFRKPEAAG